MLTCVAKLNGSGDVSASAGPCTTSLARGVVMPTQHILRTVEFKLYPNKAQAATMEAWLRRCCWLYNQALEMRVKAYKRRKESPSLYDQQVWLTRLRSRMGRIREVPVWFARSALRRLDRAFAAFFRRCKEGAAKAGFPRFKSAARYRSMEFAESRRFVRERAIFIPGVGEVRARGRFDVEGEQRILRIARRASGWYASVVIFAEPMSMSMPPSDSECGIDIGLEAFATLDSGERIENPRTLRRTEKKLQAAGRRFSRCRRGSCRREKAKARLARLHERAARKRRGFCHRVSRDLVSRFGRLAVEALNVKGLAGGRLAKSVNDAAWGFFLFCLRYKAESAGRVLVEVDPRGTSQECPACGRVAPKALSERAHRCEGCGLECHRDTAAAMVIRQRAFRPVRGGPVRPALPNRAMGAGPKKREV